MQRKNFSDFPPELQLSIFSLFSGKELITANSVCKLWNSLSNDELLWKTKLRNEFDCGPANNLHPKQYYFSLLKKYNAEQQLLRKHTIVMNSFFVPYLRRQIRETDFTKLHEEQEKINSLVLKSRESFLDNIEEIYSQNEKKAALKPDLFQHTLKDEAIFPTLPIVRNLISMCNCDNYLSLNRLYIREKKFFQEKNDLTFFIVLAASRLHINSLKVLLKMTSSVGNQLESLMPESLPINIFGAIINAMLAVARNGMKPLKQLEVAREIIKLVLDHGANPDDYIAGTRTETARESCEDHIATFANMKTQYPLPSQYQEHNGFTMEAGEKMKDILGLIANAKEKKALKEEDENKTNDLRSHFSI